MTALPGKGCVGYGSLPRAREASSFAGKSKIGASRLSACEALDFAGKLKVEPTEHGRRAAAGRRVRGVKPSKQGP